MVVQKRISEKDMSQKGQEIPAFACEALLETFPYFKIAETPQRLAGGFLNFVWRVKNASTTFPNSVIIKLAPAYIASTPEIFLDPQRILFEAMAMTLIAPGGSLGSLISPAIRLPALYKILPQKRLILMEDLGEFMDLGDWLLEAHPLLEARKLGAVLGDFVGRLHKASANNSHLAQHFSNKEIQRMRLEFQYANIQDYAQRAAMPDAENLGKKAVAFGERLQKPGTVLIMGDLWTRSVLVTPEGLRIIDWELAHYGYPAQDIGHFAAHLWMSAQCARDPRLASLSRALLKSFLQSYRTALDTDFERIFGVNGVRDSAIHFGCELLTRTVGAFQENYLYTGLSPDNPIIQESVKIAALHIRTPLKVPTFDPLGWR